MAGRPSTEEAGQTPSTTRPPPPTLPSFAMVPANFPLFVAVFSPGLTGHHHRHRSSCRGQQGKCNRRDDRHPATLPPCTFLPASSLSTKDKAFAAQA